MTSTWTSASIDALRAVLTDEDAIFIPADGIATVRVALPELMTAIERVRGLLGHARFVDLTAVDLLAREDRFELVYLFYSLEQRTWLRHIARQEIIQRWYIRRTLD